MLKHWLLSLGNKDAIKSSIKMQTSWIFTNIVTCFQLEPYRLPLTTLSILVLEQILVYIMRVFVQVRQVYRISGINLVLHLIVMQGTGATGDSGKNDQSSTSSTQCEGDSTTTSEGEAKDVKDDKK